MTRQEFNTVWCSGFGVGATITMLIAAWSYQGIFAWAVAITLILTVAVSLMAFSKFAARTLLFVAALATATSVQAGTILLAEFEFSQPEPITPPADYSFTLNNNSLVDKVLFWPVTVDAFPLTELASPEMVATFNALVTNSPNNIRRVSLVNDGQAINEFGSMPFDNIWFPDADPDDNWRAEAFVPHVPDPARDPLDRLYTGLWGYWIDEVERVITADSQLVRFRGHVIPEPATWLFVLLCVAWHLSKRSLA